MGGYNHKPNDALVIYSGAEGGSEAVSYTHLDVYKRQDMEYAIMVLMHIFEYHLLIELGLRNTGAVGKLYDRHRKLNYWYTQRCCKDDE